MGGRRLWRLIPFAGAALVAAMASTPPVSAQSAPAPVSSAAPGEDLSVRISEFKTQVADDAAIDWYATSDVPEEQQRLFIEQIFKNGLADFNAAGSAGDRELALKIEVVKFDILSDFEQLFCCAINEIDAIYQVIDVKTGVALTDAEMVGFDHIGRGGFLGLLAAAQGEGQLDRLNAVIRENTEAWLAEKLN